VFVEGNESWKDRCRADKKRGERGFLFRRNVFIHNSGNVGIIFTTGEPSKGRGMKMRLKEEREKKKFHRFGVRGEITNLLRFLQGGERKEVIFMSRTEMSGERGTGTFLDEERSLLCHCLEESAFSGHQPRERKRRRGERGYILSRLGNCEY